MIKAEKESITNQLKEENEVNKWSAVGAAEIEQSKVDALQEWAFKNYITSIFIV